MNEKVKDILKATVELIEEKDMSKVNVKEICEKANVALGTFYKYFKSKNDLAPSMYSYLDNYIKDDEARIRQMDSLEDQLNAFVVDFAEYISQWGYHANSIILLNSIVENREYDRYIERFLRELLSIKKEVLAISVEEAEALILTTLRGNLVLWKRRGPDYNAKEMMIIHGKIVVDALIKRK